MEGKNLMKTMVIILLKKKINSQETLRKKNEDKMDYRSKSLRRKLKITKKNNFNPRNVKR